MSLAVDGTCESFQFVVSGVPLALPGDAYTNVDFKTDRADRMSRGMGQQGSTETPDITGRSGSVTVRDVDRVFSLALAAYDAGVIAKALVPIQVLAVRRWPDTGERQTEMYLDVQWKDVTRSSAPGQDSTYVVQWSTGNLNVVVS